MHTSSFWVLKGMRKTETSLLQIHKTLSEAHRRCCPELVHHSWVTHTFHPQTGKSGHTGTALSASNCNTKIKAACPQHTADTQKWCTASRKESVDTKNINKGDWGKLGIRLQAEKWPLLLAAASWGTPRLSRHFKCTQGQREKREVPGRDDLWWFYACSLGYMDMTVRKGHLFSDYRDLSIHRNRLSVPAIPVPHRNCPFLATPKAVWSNIFGYLGAWNNTLQNQIYFSLLYATDFFHSRAFPDHASTVLLVNANLFLSF